MFVKYSVSWKSGSIFDNSEQVFVSGGMFAIYIYVYICVALRQPIRACSVVRNVGGVKCGPLSKP